MSHDVTNCLAVVVRYFGGTLLGVPGLINAYKTATVEALKATTITTETIKDHYQLDFDYLQMNDVMKLIKESDLLVSNQQFDAKCSLELAIRKSSVNEIIGKLSKIEGLKSTYLYSN